MEIVKYDRTGPGLRRGVGRRNVLHSHPRIMAAAACRSAGDCLEVREGGFIRVNCDESLDFKRRN